MERVEPFFEAVRTIEDVMEFLKRYSIDERMVCIVFKKAFDTVSKGFLFRTLSFFGFIIDHLLFNGSTPSLQEYLELCLKQWLFNFTLCI